MTTFLLSERTDIPVRQSATPVDEFDLHVRGSIPDALTGTIWCVVGRRPKNRTVFSNWHHSPADLLAIEIEHGRARVRVMGVQEGWVAEVPDLRGHPVASARVDRTPTCAPNHAVNRLGDRLWATNLLFGPPIELDPTSGAVRRVVLDRGIGPDARVSSSAHFAVDDGGTRTFVHQSTLESTDEGSARSYDHRILALDGSGELRSTWNVRPPDGDDASSANFHSIFWFAVDGVDHIGLLRTGVVIANWDGDRPGSFRPADRARLWIVPLDPSSEDVRAQVVEIEGAENAIALSHLAAVSESNGFTLYANWKQADVANVTSGRNVYGRGADGIAEHYAGAIVQPFAPGGVARIRWRPESTKTTVRSTPYDACRTSLGHTWLPINLHVSADRTTLFGSFGGVHPRLISGGAVEANARRGAIDYAHLRYVPPLIARFDAETLELDDHGDRGHAVYTDAVASTLVESDGEQFMVTFSVEEGLRIRLASDLSRLVSYGVNARLQRVDDRHYRTEPAHLVFVPR